MNKRHQNFPILHRFVYVFNTLSLYFHVVILVPENVVNLLFWQQYHSHSQYTEAGLMSLENQVTLPLGAMAKSSSMEPSPSSSMPFAVSSSIIPSQSLSSPSPATVAVGEQGYKAISRLSVR